MKARPIRKKAEIKEAVICPNGKKVWYDINGNVTTAPKDALDGEGIAYDDDVAKTFVMVMSEGESFSKCLAAVGIDHATYLRWRRNNPAFGASVDAAREMRSELLHDASFEKDIRPMAMGKPVQEMNDDEIELYNKQIKALAARQKIIGEFIKRDAPRRFGVKFDGNSAAAAVAITIKAEVPEELKQLVNGGFRPSLTNSGELEVKGVHITDDQEITEANGEEAEDGGNPKRKAGKRT